MSLNWRFAALGLVAALTLGACSSGSDGEDSAEACAAFKDYLAIDEVGPLEWPEGAPAYFEELVAARGLWAAKLSGEPDEAWATLSSVSDDSGNEAAKDSRAAAKKVLDKWLFEECGLQYDSEEIYQG